MREHLGCGLPPRLILEIDPRERLSVVIAHDKATDHSRQKRSRRRSVLRRIARRFFAEELFSKIGSVRRVIDNLFQDAS
jgi:hypothetical protein